MSHEQTPRPLKACAWCPGLVPGAEPELTTHGICPKCLARITDSRPPDEDIDDDDRRSNGPTIDFHE